MDLVVKRLSAQRLATLLTLVTNSRVLSLTHLKAAQALGVGLYLARSEEAMEIEAVSEPIIDPVIEELWTSFVSLSKSLSPEHKTRLGAFWEKYSNGRPKPTKATASQEDLTSLLEHCLVLSFDATVREDIVNV